MFAHRVDGQVQPTSDHLGARRLTEQGQHFTLPSRQRGANGAAVVRCEGQEVVGGEGVRATRHRHDRLCQFGDRDRLEEQPAASGRSGVVQQTGALQAGDDDRRRDRSHDSGDVDAGAVRQLVVGDDDVGSARFDPLDAFGDGREGGDHADPVPGLEAGPQSIEHQLVVVDQGDADLRAGIVGRGGHRAPRYLRHDS